MGEVLLKLYVIVGQESQRHKKIAVVSVNLISPWK